MNSYVNSNEYSKYEFMRIQIRIYIIWRSEISKYGDQGVPDPNDDADFGFGAAAVASH